KWIKRWKPNIICLQETKVSSALSFSWNNLCSFYRSNNFTMDSNGASGVVIINVYGPNDRSLKTRFLTEVSDLISAAGNLPLCIIGDFNMVRNSSEVIGHDRPLAEFNFLNDFIFHNELLDLPLVGANFTWSNMRQSPSLSRIDRAIVNPTFEASFPDCRLIGLSRICSDHRAIILQCSDLPVIRRPWKFETMWLHHNNFLDFAAENWAAYIPGKHGINLVCTKLKRLKEGLKVWNKDCFGKIQDHVDNITNAISALDGLEEAGNLTNEARLHRCSLKADLDFWWKMDEINWRQKSGALWLRYGDRNSSFFHRSANSRKKRNWIDRLIVDGQEFVGQRDISSPIVNHFKHFFEEPLPENRPLPRNLPFAKINSVQATTISRQFSEEEVWRCIQISESEKAPGPDGFNMGFIKHCWSFIKSDFMNALWDFQSSSIIPKGANSTFICLIPKKDSVRDIKDLRPISLIGIFYKILSKCLMCRFRSCLKEVISSPQCAFLDGRQISEASLLANEIIDSRRSSGKNGLVFKLDLEKAFDSVNWECIIFMLERFNFPPIWISWIRSCISSAHFSILINGAAEGYFENHRGIRQGDSLSPYLFICVMELLSKMLEVASGNGLVSGFFMNERHRNGQITHLLYADDTLIFCDAEDSQVKHLMAILICFQ
ncbi:Transposon TX1 uncharacterized 149 kDa protein, partial [Linum grandiflorum]